MTFQVSVLDDLGEWASARAAALGLSLDAYIRFLVIGDQQRQHTAGRKTPVMKYDSERKCNRCGRVITKQNKSGRCKGCLWKIA